MEYLFFIDATVILKTVANAIADLDRISRFVKVLGSYPKQAAMLSQAGQKFDVELAAVKAVRGGLNATLTKLWR